MKPNTAILTCILGDFDTPVDPVSQSIPYAFHRFTDEDFPPVTGLTPRLQYRIPKTHGFEMFPGYDYYLWLDGAMSLGIDCLEWYLKELGDGDIAFFKHPDRETIKEEVEHIEEHLKLEKPYISSRYKNGLHRESFNKTGDDRLFASTVFIYRNTPKVQEALKDWFYEGTRYFTCDQVQLSYILKKHNLNVKVFSEHIYKTKYLNRVSNHK